MKDIDYVEYNLRDNLLQEQEYKERIKYFKTDFKGSLTIPPEANFHPSLFKGTQEEYDNIYNKYLKGHEDEFKIIGTHTFNTYEDYLKVFKNLVA